MDLRKKTLLNLSIALAVIIIAIIVFSSTFLLTSYEKLESDRVQSDANLVLKNLHGELSGLRSLAMDMAVWDDAYAFAKGEKPDFIEKNFGKTTFSRQDLNIVIITNTHGDIL
jgi:sensor domain CHASE-containing protein